MTENGRMAATVLAAFCFVLAAALTYFSFVWTRSGQWLDSSAFQLAGVVSNSPLAVLLTAARTGTVIALATVGLAAGIAALIRRRLRAALAALLLVVAGTALARLLRSQLPRPYLGEFAYPANTLPSGHAAAAAALVLALLILIPVSWRTLTLRAAAVGLVTLAGMASVFSFAHRPSDVFVAILLVGALGCVAVLIAGYTPPMRSLNWPVAATVVALLSYLGLLWSPGFLERLLAGLAPVAATLAAASWIIVMITPESKKT